MQKRRRAPVCVGRRHLDAAGRLILAQPVFQGAGRPLHVALDDGPVDLFDGAVAELAGEAGGGLARPREQQHARSRLVEPMDDPRKTLPGFLYLSLRYALPPGPPSPRGRRSGCWGRRSAWRRRRSDCLHTGCPEAVSRLIGTLVLAGRSKRSARTSSRRRPFDRSKAAGRPSRKKDEGRPNSGRGMRRRGVRCRAMKDFGRLSPRARRLTGPPKLSLRGEGFSGIAPDVLVQPRNLIRPDDSFPSSRRNGVHENTDLVSGHA